MRQWTVPVNAGVEDLFGVVIPTDAKSVGEITTHVHEDHTDYEMTLKLTWTRKHTQGPPWILPAQGRPIAHS